MVGVDFFNGFSNYSVELTVVALDCLFSPILGLVKCDNGRLLVVML